jgi:hypothetical protein
MLGFGSILSTAFNRSLILPLNYLLYLDLLPSCPLILEIICSVPLEGATGGLDPELDRNQLSTNARRFERPRRDLMLDVPPPYPQL